VTRTRKRLGLVVNPIAGIGGRVGLKGSDGAEIVRQAFEKGALPESPARATEALRASALAPEDLTLLAYPRSMGADEARAAGFEPRVVGRIEGPQTTAEDTKEAARTMAAEGVDLLLFAGGDGTARDVLDAVGGRVVALGIPTGVKIQSAVFAVSPRAAGRLAAEYLHGRTTRVREREVMDIDEAAFREDRVVARLHGYLRVPEEAHLLQGPKSGSIPDEAHATEAIASQVIEDMRDDHAYLVGPGTTTRPILQRLGLPKTLLGVDAVYRRRILVADADEAQLLDVLRDLRAILVVTVIGSQGFLFGRGNQQLSPRVLRLIGRDRLVVVATPEKIASLRGRPLLVDTGDADLDRAFEGYLRILTGYGRSVVYPVEAA